MMNIELTTMQKIQVAFVGVVLLVAGFMLFRNTRPVLNPSVSAWTIKKQYPVDLSKPAGPANLYDPKKEETLHTFACYDGQLQIIEYRGDPEKRPKITWSKVNTNRKDFIYYKDPMGPVKEVKDPYRHGLALATYSAANGRMLGLLAPTGLTPEQIAAEKKARDVMMDSINLIKMSVENNTFHPELMEKVMTALNEFRRKTGSPDTDPVKAELVRNVFKTATDFLAMVEKEKGADIQRYMAKLDEILTAEQKVKLADAAKAAEAKGVKVATAGGGGAGRRDGGGAATPAGRGGTTPVNRGGRGGAATAPAAG